MEHLKPNLLNHSQFRTLEYSSSYALDDVCHPPQKKRQYLHSTITHISAIGMKDVYSSY